MMHARQLIMISVIGIVALLLLLSLVFFRTRPAPGVTPTGTIRPTATGFIAASPTARITPTWTEKRKAIDDVSVRDFTQFSEILHQNGDAVITQTDSYQISFLSEKQSFHITVTDSPFDAQAAQAEKEFLRILGISQDQACRLTVYVETLGAINPDEGGKRFPLSFCEHEV